MKMFRLLSLVLLFGVSAVAAFADGSSGTDPKGSFHSPGGGGTPGAGLNFSLPPFGTSNAACGFFASTQTENCIFQNVSGVNWSSVTLFTTDSNGCAGISLNTNLFESATCVVGGNGDAILKFSGVNVNESDPGNGSNAICTPSAGIFPGVIAGCDFEISLGPGADEGNWPAGMTTDAAANPEPSTIVLIVTGCAGLLFLVIRRKNTLFDVSY
jgi:hypothetical protein